MKEIYLRVVQTDHRSTSFRGRCSQSDESGTKRGGVRTALLCVGVEWGGLWGLFPWNSGWVARTNRNTSIQREDEPRSFGGKTCGPKRTAALRIDPGKISRNGLPFLFFYFFFLFPCWDYFSELWCCLWIMKETLTMKFGWKTKMVKELNETWFFQPRVRRCWLCGLGRECGGWGITGRAGQTVEGEGRGGGGYRQAW